MIKIGNRIVARESIKRKRVDRDKFDNDNGEREIQNDDVKSIRRGEKGKTEETGNSKLHSDSLNTRLQARSTS